MKPSSNTNITARIGMACIARMARAKLRLRARQPSEHQLHVAVAQYLDRALRPPVIWTSIDAGAGRMSKAAAGMRKARGVKRGWPDILIIAPGPLVLGPIALGIELKTKVGRQSLEQRAVEQAFADCHAWYILCRSVEEVEAALRYCHVPLHATVRT